MGRTGGTASKAASGVTAKILKKPSLPKALLPTKSSTSLKFPPSSSSSTFSSSSCLSLSSPEIAFQTLLDSIKDDPPTLGGWRMVDSLKHLVEVEPKFLPIIARHGVLKSFYTTEIDKKVKSPFQALTKTIIYQQLAPAAAEKIMDRCFASFGVTKSDTIEPKHILNAKFEIQFIGGKKKVMIKDSPSGLSENKMKALVSLAESFSSEKLLRNVNLHNLSVPELQEKLIAIRGLGPWSVDMFCMFHLCKPDVMPLGDLGVRKGIYKLHDLAPAAVGANSNSKSIKEEQARCKELTLSWSPFSSVGASYMWRINDDHM
jgi:DNA-3-methyladenine glycosylase II